MLLLVLILAFGGLAGAKGIPPGFSYSMPNPGAFKGWERKAQEESSDIDPYAWQKAPFACDRPGIFPTHPQMSLKKYHLVLIGRYDHFRLEGGEEACAIGGKKPNGKGVIPCFRPDIFHYVLLSDTYQDACGHYFRGVKEIAFFLRHENMGTLFSPGRGMLRKAGSEFDEYVVAPTYDSKPEDFLFFIQLLPGDLERIGKDREQALQSGFSFDPGSGLFERK
jgi:hypothetical protein